MSGTVWIFAGFVFLSGLITIVMRRNLLAMLMGLELMISGANVGLVYSAEILRDPSGLSAALLVIAVAAAEAVVGLSLILIVFRSGSPEDSSILAELKG
jgi:NADH-quinone oxidoreductase subunit K